MADYTEIQSENLEPGAPWISSTAFALRDNPTAIAEGAAGAPRIEDAALATNATDAGRDWVLARTATAAVGTVGSYAMMFLGPVTGEVRDPGYTAAGSDLRFASASGGRFIDAPGGTWRLMGFISVSETDDSKTSLWLRIS